MLDGWMEGGITIPRANPAMKYFLLTSLVFFAWFENSSGVVSPSQKKFMHSFKLSHETKNLMKKYFAA